MIDKGKMILSAKLAKQLEGLKCKPKNIAFGQMLDAIGERMNRPLTPAQRRASQRRG